MAASLALTAVVIAASAVNLDLDAADDFIVLGDGNFHTAGVTVRSRKSGGGSTITIGKYGSTPELYTYNDSPRGVSYTGGTPQASDSGWISGCYDGTNDGGGTTVGGGLTVTAPASTTKRRLRIYWGTWACRCTVQASLSDGSASAVSNTTTIDTPSGGTGYIEVEYEAGSGGQTLLVNFFTNRVDSAYGNTTIQAATVKAIAAAGSTITAASGVATTSTLAGRSTVARAATAVTGLATASTLAGRSTVARAPTAAAGLATASTLAGRATAASTPTAAAGTATAGTLVGSAITIVAGSPTPAAGVATTSNLAGSSSAAAGLTAAAGTATAATLGAASVAAASITPAAGQAVAADLVGSSSAPGQADIVPAAGQATTSTLASSVTVAASMVPAAGVAITATLGSNGVPETRSMGFEMSSGRIREVRIKPLLQRVLEARNSRRVRPQRDRAAQRAKRIEVQAAQMLLDDDATRAEFEGLLTAWRVQRPEVPENVAPVEAFMSQVAFRIEQQGAMAEAIALMHAQQRARNDEEAIALLLLA